VASVSQGLSLVGDCKDISADRDYFI